MKEKYLIKKKKCLDFFLLTPETREPLVYNYFKKEKKSSF